LDINKLATETSSIRELHFRLCLYHRIFIITMMGEPTDKTRAKSALKPKKFGKLPKSQFAQYSQRASTRPCELMLEADARITKRPLFRPAIPSPHSSSASQKVVYVSQKTPFVAALKRVRKLLELTDRRAVQSKVDMRPHHSTHQKITAAAEARIEPSKREKVWIKATGRSIDKALQLALHFQEQRDCAVELRTSSVWAIDDIVVDDPDEGIDEDGKDEEQGKPLPGARMRPLSSLEVGVSLR
jgi:ribonuclease P/MRP protein subunit POP7